MTPALFTPRIHVRVHPPACVHHPLTPSTPSPSDPVDGIKCKTWGPSTVQRGHQRSSCSFGDHRWSKSAPNLEKSLRHLGHSNIGALQELGTDVVRPAFLGESNRLNSAVVPETKTKNCIFYFLFFLAVFSAVRPTCLLALDVVHATRQASRC